MTDLELASVTGGGAAGAALKVASTGFWVLDWGTSAYDGYAGYRDARAEGKGVGSSLGNGAKEFVRSVTLYDLWKVSPAY